MKLALKWKYIPFNPLEGLPWYKEDIGKFDFWNFDESNQFLTWALLSKCPRFSIYLTAYKLGLRMEEIIGLYKDAINLNQRLIHIRQSYCKASKKMNRLTKSGHERILGLSNTLHESLNKIISQSNDVDFLFTHGKDKRITHDYLRYHFIKDQEKAGVRKITFHSLRHTFASHFVMRGGNIYDLKALLGHADISTTMRYAHLAPDHLIKKASVVNFKIPNTENVIQLKA